MPIVSLQELLEKRPPKTRVMAIDHSKSAWGLALANPELTVATPLKTIVCSKFSKDAPILAALIKEYNVGGLIIGLPLGHDGQDTRRTESVRHFADNLLGARTVFENEPLIAFQDERFSTDAAQELAQAAQTQAIDALAALDILKKALKIT